MAEKLSAAAERNFDYIPCEPVDALLLCSSDPTGVCTALTPAYKIAAVKVKGLHKRTNVPEMNQTNESLASSPGN